LRQASGDTPSVYPGHPDYKSQSKETADVMSTFPEGVEVALPDEMHYRVLADEMTIPKQSEVGDRDSLTVPVAENPKKTEVTFDAEGSGYGLRLRLVGGVQNIDDSLDSLPFPSCWRPNRELLAGWVNYARLGDVETSARSLGLEADSTTKIDFQGPVTACNPPVDDSDLPAPTKDVNGPAWSLFLEARNTANNIAGSGAVGPAQAPTSLSWDKHFKVATCAGNTSQVTQTTGADVYGAADCKQTNGRVEGTARSNFAVTNTVFSVGEASSNVAVARDPAKGVVVTSTAIARGIKLQDLSIAFVETKAVSWSNGRPFNDPRGTFTRRICGVSYPGYENQGCMNPTQQQQMVDNWNKGWGFHGKMSLPTYDPAYFQGSPGGYISGVIKPIADLTEDTFFALDTQNEVVGLMVEFYPQTVSTSQKPDRKVLQLAGVRAVTGFGVQCQFDLVYSPLPTPDCVAPPEEAFLDDPLEEEEIVTDDEGAFNDYQEDSGWEPVEATGPIPELALGRRIGRFIENLPVLRQLPIRQMGEALLAGSVWMLLGMPLFLASRRFALHFARRS
jgi:hypothetical protein